LEDGYVSEVSVGHAKTPVVEFIVAPGNAGKKAYVSVLLSGLTTVAPTSMVNVVPLVKVKLVGSGLKVISGYRT
jgi:hypothetical protein